MTSLYDILGVASGATPEDVRAAYRAKAMKAHPDRGGTTDEFQCLTKAYTILSDSDRRAQYDKDGSTGEAPDPEAKVHHDLLMIALSILDQINPSNSDLVQIMKDQILLQMANHHRAASVCDTRIKSRMEAVKRLSYSDNDRFLMEAIEADILSHQESKKRIEAGVAHGHKLLDALSKYGYTVDAAAFAPPSRYFVSSTAI